MLRAIKRGTTLIPACAGTQLFNAEIRMRLTSLTDPFIQWFCLAFTILNSLKKPKRITYSDLRVINSLQNLRF